MDPACRTRNILWDRCEITVTDEPAESGTYNSAGSRTTAAASIPARVAPYTSWSTMPGIPGKRWSNWRGTGASAAGVPAPGVEAAEVGDAAVPLRSPVGPHAGGNEGATSAQPARDTSDKTT